MANKKSKSVQQTAYISKRQAQDIAAQKKKRNTIITIAIITVISIAAIAGLVALALSEDVMDADGKYDYFQNKASKYVSMDSSLYKSPEITIPAYLNGTDEAVAKYIERLCEENAVSTGNKITDQPIKEGDTVAIYYEGWLNGEKFSGGSNMDDSAPYALKIGSGTFIAGFEDALIGIIPANTSKDNMADLNLTFPESYHNSELAGKDVVFKVYVEYIKETVPAEYTDDFIKNTLASKLGYTAPESDVKADFEKFLKDEYLPALRTQAIQDAVWDKMLENAKIKGYPKGEVERIYSSYESQYKQEYSQYFSKAYASFEVFMTAYYGSNWKLRIENLSKSDITNNLIYHYIAQSENITVNDEEYEDAIRYFIDNYAAQGQEITSDQVEEYYGKSGVKQYVISKKVSELIVKNAIVSYE